MGYQAYTGLFTFAHSPGHIHLYEKFGFWARFLTAVMSKPVTEREPAAQRAKFSELSEGEREDSLNSCRELTDTSYDGLDVTGEIRAIDTQGLGDTLLLWDEGRLFEVAACH